MTDIKLADKKGYEKREEYSYSSLFTERRGDLPMKERLKRNPLLKTLFELEGNTRACVYTEPMWGLSMNLCLPYASVYMLAIGLTDTEVGIVTSVFLFSQMIFAFLAGAINDKIGRRKGPAIFDVIGWSILCLIWASSQGFWFFVVAALLNGSTRIAGVSWGCLLIEDAPKDKTTKIHSLITIGSNMSALFAPISSILVSKLTLVPAIRILYINAFFVMTAKIIVLYKTTTETKIGKIKMEESKDKSLRELLSGYKGVFKKMTGSRGIKFALIINIIVEIVITIGTTFWQIIVSRRIGVPNELLPIFPMIKSILAIVLVLLIVSKMKQSNLKLPLHVSFLSYIISYIILISIPQANALGYIMLFLSIVFETLGHSVLLTLRESLVAIYADPVDRSTIMGLLQTVVMFVSMPFGYIAGRLSDISRTLPFVLAIGILLLGMLATAVYYHNEGKKAKV